MIKSGVFICCLIGLVVKIVLYLHFLSTKDDKLHRLKRNMSDGTIVFLTSLLLP